MSKLVLGLLGALIATNRPGAVSNLVAETTGISISVPNSNDPVEQEYQKLLAADDAAQEEVDHWIQEDQKAEEHSPTLKLRIEQRLNGVKKDYENFLLRNPNHARARLAFGSFLQDIHEEDEGVKQFELALKLDPKNPAAWNNLANYYGHRSPVKKAFEYYEKAIELDPTEPVYRWNFATTVYLFRKDATEYYKIDERQVFDKALELYRQALKLDPRNFILASDYAQSFYGTKPPRYKEGLAAWQDALKIARDDVERDGVRIHLGRINWKLGNFEEARRQLNAITNSMYKLSKEKLLDNVAKSEAESAARPAEKTGAGN